MRSTNLWICAKDGITAAIRAEAAMARTKRILTSYSKKKWPQKRIIAMALTLLQDELRKGYTLDRLATRLERQEAERNKQMGAAKR